MEFIISVELIQITDKTSVPYAAKAAKTLEKIKKKEEEKRVVSEQAPPAEKKKEKPDRIPLPEDLNKEKKKIVKKKQNPEEIKEDLTIELKVQILNLELKIAIKKKLAVLLLVQ